MRPQERLIKGTGEGSYDGLRTVKQGVRVGDVSAAIEENTPQI